jgi:putative hydrolase of the HAD superfamily
VDRRASHARPQLTWLFDLDNTLHDASHAIFPAINANMNALIARVLDAESKPAHADAVNAVRMAYWQRYGATLLGMMRHHAVRAEDFLRDAHRFDDLAQMIRAERGIGRLLMRLPGKKILLTNAPAAYSHAVLRHLGLHRHFAAHLPIESMHVHRQLRPKPSRLLLHKILAKQGLRPARCVLVEDTMQNLKAAKSLGLRTVWTTRYLNVSAARPAFVNVKVKSLRQLPKQLHKLGVLR